MKLLLMFYEKKQLNTVLVNKGGGVVIKDMFVNLSRKCQR